MHRLAHLMLAVIVLLAATSSCPSGGSCPTMQQAAHKCCAGSTDSIRAADCCNDGYQITGRGLGTERGPEWSLPVVFRSDRDTTTASSPVAYGVVAFSRGLAPPGSLLAQHTSLLL